MPKYIDEQLWWDYLARPDWYNFVMDDFKRLEELAAKEPDRRLRKPIKRSAYKLIEKALASHHIPLAPSGNNLDAERRSIDTVVIRHTLNPPGMSLDRLNAMQLLRIYGGYYNHPTDKREAYLQGGPVWSGHFYKEAQVFWGYHWFVRSDGRYEQILKDSYIGWHAGNWDINTRSIGICFDDDLTDKQPTVAALNAVAKIISSHYGQVKPDNIIGHHQANPKTECPGKLFIDIWRNKLIQQLARSA